MRTVTNNQSTKLNLPSADRNGRGNSAKSLQEGPRPSSFTTADEAFRVSHFVKYGTDSAYDFSGPLPSHHFIRRFTGEFAWLLPSDSPTSGIILLSFPMSTFACVGCCAGGAPKWEIVEGRVRWTVWGKLISQRKKVSRGCWFRGQLISGA